MLKKVKLFKRPQHQNDYFPFRNKTFDQKEIRKTIPKQIHKHVSTSYVSLITFNYCGQRGHMKFECLTRPKDL